ncbi:MAG: hypothetical protein AB8B72_13545 [Crocinitomicaceae bacterium]
MRFLIAAYLVVLPTLVFSDTLDYWTVYLNDSLIASYNLASTNKSITLNRELLSSKDTISVFYANDHPCTKCEYYFAAEDVKGGVKVHTDRVKRQFRLVYFPLSKLINFKTGNEFKFSVVEIAYKDGQTKYCPLFVLKIE